MSDRWLELTKGAAFGVRPADNTEAVDVMAKRVETMDERFAQLERETTQLQRLTAEIAELNDTSHRASLRRDVLLLVVLVLAIVGAVWLA